MTTQLLALLDLRYRAESGQISDIDYLMNQLYDEQNFANCKMLDYALGLVSSEQGKARIKHFLFNGNQIQRNYAALYFKRRGIEHLLDEAVRRGCIDEAQAYSK